MFNPIIKGIFFGFLIAAPVGPIGILCIKRSLSNGPRSGFISGLGAATADGVYGLIAALGLGFLTKLLMDWQIFLRLVAGCFLFILGVRFIISKPNLDKEVETTGKYWSYYLTTFVLTLSNPMTILSFGAVFAGLGFNLVSDGLIEGLLLVMGVFIGSAIWWLLLALITGIVRTRLQTKYYLWVNKISGLILTSFALIIFFTLLTPAKKPISSTVLNNPIHSTISGDSSVYARALPGRQFNFPADYGPHPEYQTEWWYYTGNVVDSDGHRFGYQLTIFRRSLIPIQESQQRPSLWAADQVYLGHFAITDVSKGDHFSFEMLDRGAVGLSGAQSVPFSVWLRNWQVSEVGPESYRLRAAAWLENGSPIRIDLELKNDKGIVLHGDQGYSKKGPGEGNASYYYSMTRLLTVGEVQIGNRSFDVDGLSWMDHEFSTSALSSDQLGWDWFSIQFEDGSELMVFQIRKQDGSIDPYSSGTWISPDNQIIGLEKGDFSIENLDYWKSDRSGGNYPSRWILKIEKLNLRINIEPMVVDQEMDLTYTYWEGAVQVKGLKGEVQIDGFGYVEMTGYAGTMAGEF